MSVRILLGNREDSNLAGMMQIALAMDIVELDHTFQILL